MDENRRDWAADGPVGNEGGRSPSTLTPGRGALARGQRGRAAPALADHRPIHLIISIVSLHAAVRHAGSRVDKWLSSETGCSSGEISAEAFALFSERIGPSLRKALGGKSH